VIPARLRRWILIWTPVVWLVLELCTYPKDIIVKPEKFFWEAGVAKIVRGFFDAQVANYPAWVILPFGVVITVVGAYGLVHARKGRRFPLAITITGVVFLLWGLVAAGLPGSFALPGRTDGWGWLWQTAVIGGVATCVWMWGASNPERAELTVWNTRQVWRLYRRNWQGMAGLYILIIVAAVALLAPFLAGHYYLNPTEAVAPAFSGPAPEYYRLFGATELGQSVIAEFIWSARISLVVGLLATVISTVIGAAIGIGAGYYGGWRGEAGMRLTDVFLVIPWLPLAMVLAAAWGTNYLIIMLIIAITSWPGTARVVRSQVLAVKELPFIERGRAIGSSNLHIMNKHILPNVFPLIFANTILVVAIAILSETTLSFLGLGDPLRFSWGTMLHYVWASGGSTLPSTRMYVLAPGLAIVLIVVAFTFMGTAFDEVLDPKLRKREESGGAPGDEDKDKTPGLGERVLAPTPGGGGGGMITGAPGGRVQDEEVLS
jgi:peptide/nickel transport system permease protein